MVSEMQINTGAQSFSELFPVKRRYCSSLGFRDRAPSIGIGGLLCRVVQCSRLRCAGTWQEFELLPASSSSQHKVV